MTVTFSENITNVPTTSTVSLKDKGGTGSNDAVLMPGLLGDGTTFTDLGSTGYITTNNATVTFASTVSASTNQFVLTLGTCSGTACASGLGAGTSTSFVYTPATGITDAAGNAAAGSITKTTFKLF